jgi:uncharacterized membrane protein
MTRWLPLSIVFALAAFAGSAYVAQVRFDELPDRVATHWNIRGEPDGWTPKDQLGFLFWGLPSFMVLFVVLTVVLPHWSPKSFEVESFRGIYGFIMMLAVGLMGYIHGVLLWSMLHVGTLVGDLLMTGIFGFFAVLGPVLPRVRRNFWMGIRTPWTLASVEVWDRTHRLAAWTMAGVGLLGLGIVWAGLFNGWWIVLLVLAMLAPVVYSLVLYKSLERQDKLEPPSPPSTGNYGRAPG